MLFSAVTLALCVIIDHTLSGCDLYVIREGWEGLVRGNEVEKSPEANEARRQGFVSTYGEGELLKQGEGEQTLAGRYIIQVSTQPTPPTIYVWTQ